MHVCLPSALAAVVAVTLVLPCLQPARNNVVRFCGCVHARAEISTYDVLRSNKTLRSREHVPAYHRRHITHQPNVLEAGCTDSAGCDALAM